MKHRRKFKILGPFWGFVCLVTWWVGDHPFFWDAVQLASKHAHWYYEQNFQYFLLPASIDSGHPPMFGMYLALCWQLFGKSLMVSHFSMLPFLLGITWLLYELGVFFGNHQSAIFLILLIFVDPFYAGQSVLVTPDIVLVFAFLLSVYSILLNKKWLLGIGAILLGMISMRGMMVGFGLYCWSIYLAFIQAEKKDHTFSFLVKTAVHKLSTFLPAGLLALSFLIYHYHIVGWVGYHTDSPWAGSFASVNSAEFFKNIGLLVWRFLDFGRLFLLGGLAWMMYYFFKNSSTHSGKSLFILIGILLLLITPSLLLHKGLMSHRYLLPITITVTLLFYHLCFLINQNKTLQKTVFILAFLGLLTGNLWIYPKQIAQGWDATLAHLPYYDLRFKMIQFIDQEQIPYQTIGTVFPNIGPIELYDLNGRQEGFVEKDLKKNHYFFYSNVFNDLSDEELIDLKDNWTPVQQFKANGIEIILYHTSDN